MAEHQDSDSPRDWGRKSDAERLLGLFRYYQKARDEYLEAIESISHGPTIRAALQDGPTVAAYPSLEQKVEDALQALIDAE